MGTLRRDKLKCPLLQLVLGPQLVYPVFLLFSSQFPSRSASRSAGLGGFPDGMIHSLTFQGSQPLVTMLFTGQGIALPGWELFLSGVLWHEVSNMLYCAGNGTLAASPVGGAQPVGSWDSKAAGPRVPGSVIRLPKCVIRSSRPFFLVSQTPAFHLPGTQNYMEAFDLKCALN